MLLKAMQVLMMLKLWILLTLNYNLKSAIKSKLAELLSELRSFRFVATLVLLFKKKESKDKTIYDNFYSHSKLSMKVTLRMCLNQAIL